MSQFSVLEHQVAHGFLSVMRTLVGNSALDPAVKNEATGILDSISNTVSTFNETVSNAAQGLERAEAPAIEQAAGDIVSNVVEGAAKELPGPVGDVVDIAAQTFLQAAGGDVALAVNKLLNIKTSA